MAEVSRWSRCQSLTPCVSDIWVNIFNNKACLFRLLLSIVAKAQRVGFVPFPNELEVGESAAIWLQERYICCISVVNCLHWNINWAFILSHQKWRFLNDHWSRGGVNRLIAQPFGCRRNICIVANCLHWKFDDDLFSVKLLLKHMI